MSISLWYIFLFPDASTALQLRDLLSVTLNKSANFAVTLKTLSIQTSSSYVSFLPITAFDNCFDNITFSSQPFEFPTLLGDANLDGVVDFSDIPAFVAVLISGDYQREADCDQNEVVNFADIPAFIGILTNQ